MLQLPQHQSSQFPRGGISLHRIGAHNPEDTSATDAHQDDYYVFGLIERGRGWGLIDFKEQCFSSNDLFLIQPGQVHRMIRSDNAEGWLLMADGSLVGDEEKCIFERFSLYASSVTTDERQKNELMRIAALLAERTDKTGNRLSQTIAARLAEAFIGMVAEVLQHYTLPLDKYGHRYREIVLAFRWQLALHLCHDRRPSYYASLLNISTSYLNEAVKKVTGLSTSVYIMNEMILQAKRLLVHTPLTVKETAFRLGIDDCAYFSRLFARATGISPAAFRDKNLE